MPDISALDGEHENETFTGLEGDHCALDAAYFYHCTFQNASLQYAKLTGCTFEHCIFDSCNLSLLQLPASKIVSTTFRDSKLSGIHWSSLSGIFSATFNGCVMDNNSFSSMNLSKYTFTGCTFREASFTDTKLCHATFDDCDLSRCTFHNTDLTSADFSTSHNYFMHADTNILRKTVFSLPEAVALLRNFNIVLK